MIIIIFFDIQNNSKSAVKIIYVGLLGAFCGK